MTITTAYDVTGINLGKQPAGQLAGYDTGSQGIAWTAEQYAAHPGAVHIDQDPAASDFTADVLDVERGAATIAEAASWFARTYANYIAGKRYGQRYPAIYISASNVTPLANALLNAGHNVTPRLWVAHWGETAAQADAQIANAGGPWPIIGLQIASREFYDLDLFSSVWLATVSRPPVPAPPPWLLEAMTDIATAQSALAAIGKILTANVK